MTIKNCFVFWSRIHFQIWIYHLSSAQFNARFVYTSLAILRAYSILIAPRCSRHVMSWRSSLADWRFSFVVSLSSRLVVCEVWRVVQGLARNIRLHSHCKASRAEPNRTEPKRFGLENKPTLWNGSINRQRRTEQSRTEQDWAVCMFCVYLLRYPDSLLHSDCSASLSARHVASLFSCGLTLRFRRIPLVASRCLWGMTCRAGIGQKH
jgi:hypothetical protein